DQVKASELVGPDVVRLDAFLAVGDRGDVMSDLLGPQRVADVDGAQPGIEVGEEDQVLPRAFRRDVLDDVVRAEAPWPVEILLALGEKGGDRQRVLFVADVDDPHELAVPELLPRPRLVGDDEIRTVADGPGGASPV